MEDVFIAYYKRTAFSRSRPKEPERDLFNGIRMDYALSNLIKDCIKRTGINPLDIGDVIIGCAYQRDENWTFGGRHPVLLAHLPTQVTSVSLDRACSSSLNAIAMGAMEIMTGNADIVLAGGFEHMTHVPRLSNRLCEKLLEPEYAEYEMNIGYQMGLTAEKLAKLEGIKREEMDRFAFRSHNLASRAERDGYLSGEIMPLTVENNGKRTVVDKDQSIRHETSIEMMAALQPAFSEGGLITAGNSSPLNAGASLVMLISRKKLKEYGIEPLSKVVSFGWAGVDPSIMGEAVVPAARVALQRAGLTAKDIDLWEINEAFAVVVLNAIRKLSIEEERVNTRGGAIAIGHPLGATGARIAGTLSRLLHSAKGSRGIAALCVGGGQGYAMVLETV
ncbi:MAG: acetyl-CoA C-acetyltransferase [Methanomassiliicoccales archaeon]